jgi:hypothetical protein
MNKAVLLCFVSVTMAFVGVQVGCSDGGDDDTADADGAACFDYAGFDGASPPTSFRTDVLPLFQRSCGIGGATCHGDGAPMGQPYLGPAMGTMATDEQIAEIISATVGRPSTKGGGMQIISAGNPQQSFLMHKMDGLCGAELTCEGSACGDTMPQTGDLLPESERNVVRRWIAQGAADD